MPGSADSSREVLTYMNIAPYRDVLRQPGLASLMLIGLLARIPATAAGMAITLHVVSGLKLDYAAAGIAGAVAMAGVGVGSPLAGRFVDRVGARPVLILTTIAQAAYWAVAPNLTYSALLVWGFISGVLSLPLFTVLRQFFVALAPVDQRRTVFALDAMAVELSYMLGPALAVAGITSIGSAATLYAVGAGLTAAGVALIILNPPIRSEDEQAEIGERVPRRQWLTGRMVVLLGVSVATTFVLASTELSVVALLRGSGATEWTGLVIGVWCSYSLIGGFIYGSLRESLSPLVLVGGLAVFTLPVGLVTGGWWWLMLALIPAGLFCAPSLTATVDTVNAWVPPSARGEAMGLHGTALTVGVALGAPFAGAVIDAVGPGWGFVTGGGVGIALVLIAVPLWPRRAVATAAPATSTPAASTAAGQAILPTPVAAER